MLLLIEFVVLLSAGSLNYCLRTIDSVENCSLPDFNLISSISEFYGQIAGDTEIALEVISSPEEPSVEINGNNISSLKSLVIYGHIISLISLVNFDKQLLLSLVEVNVEIMQLDVSFSTIRLKRVVFINKDPALDNSDKNQGIKTNGLFELRSYDLQSDFYSLQNFDKVTLYGTAKIFGREIGDMPTKNIKEIFIFGPNKADAILIDGIYAHSLINVFDERITMKLIETGITINFNGVIGDAGKWGFAIQHDIPNKVIDLSVDCNKMTTYSYIGVLISNSAILNLIKAEMFNNFGNLNDIYLMDNSIVNIFDSTWGMLLRLYGKNTTLGLYGTNMKFPSFYLNGQNSDLTFVSNLSIKNKEKHKKESIHNFNNKENLKKENNNNNKILNNNRKNQKVEGNKENEYEGSNKLNNDNVLFINQNEGFLMNLKNYKQYAHNIINDNINEKKKFSPKPNNEMKDIFDEEIMFYSREFILNGFNVTIRKNPACEVRINYLISYFNGGLLNYDFLFDNYEFVAQSPVQVNAKDILMEQQMFFDVHLSYKDPMIFVENEFKYINPNKKVWISWPTFKKTPTDEEITAVLNEKYYMFCSHKIACSDFDLSHHLDNEPFGFSKETSYMEMFCDINESDGNVCTGIKFIDIPSHVNISVCYYETDEGLCLKNNFNKTINKDNINEKMKEFASKGTHQINFILAENMSENIYLDLSNNNFVQTSIFDVRFQFQKLEDGTNKYLRKVNIKFDEKIGAKIDKFIFKNVFVKLLPQNADEIDLKINVIELLETVRIDTENSKVSFDKIKAIMISDPIDFGKSDIRPFKKVIVDINSKDFLFSLIFRDFGWQINQRKGISPIYSPSKEERESTEVVFSMNPEHPRLEIQMELNATSDENLLPVRFEARDADYNNMTTKEYFYFNWKESFKNYVNKNSTILVQCDGSDVISLDTFGHYIPISCPYAKDWSLTVHWLNEPVHFPFQETYSDSINIWGDLKEWFFWFDGLKLMTNQNVTIYTSDVDNVDRIVVIQRIETVFKNIFVSLRKICFDKLFEIQENTYFLLEHINFNETSLVANVLINNDIQGVSAAAFDLKDILNLPKEVIINIGFPNDVEQDCTKFLKINEKILLYSSEHVQEMYNRTIIGKLSHCVKEFNLIQNNQNVYINISEINIDSESVSIISSSTSSDDDSDDDDDMKKKMKYVIIGGSVGAVSVVIIIIIIIIVMIKKKNREGSLVNATPLITTDNK